ncbi:MAG: serine/threonine-protein kinase [Pseudomonadota bacterium]
MGKAQLRVDEQVFANELEAGTPLMHGQYTILSFLKAGGFGITYNALDSLNRRVVIKECFPAAFCRRVMAQVAAHSPAHQSKLASIVRLFVQEAHMLAKLDHPNIIGVQQVFEENNTAYMVLDFVEGRDLLDMIEDGDVGLEPQQVDAILRKLLSAIHFMHDQGILHRDIAPDNLLLNQNKEPVLIDFGAAHELNTRPGRVVSALRAVKDGYSPQEFYVAGSDQGPSSDLYALGASFYHLMTGELPPNAQTRLAAVASGEADPYRPLVHRLPTYSKTFLSALDQSLAILPKDRIASAAAWLDTIDGKGGDHVANLITRAAAKTSAKSVEPKSQKGLMLASIAAIAAAAVGLVATQSGVFAQIDKAPSVEAAAVAALARPPLAIQTPVVIPGTSEDSRPVVSHPAPLQSQPVTASVPLAEDVVRSAPLPKTASRTTATLAVVETATPTLPMISTDHIHAPWRKMPLQPGTDAALNVIDPVPAPVTLAQFSMSYEEALHRTAALDRSVAAADAAGKHLLAIDPAVLSAQLPVAAKRLDMSGIQSGWNPVLPTDRYSDAGADQVTGATQRRAVQDQTGTLPTAHRTVLLNGLTFEAASEPNGWVTRVTAVPKGLSTDLQVGDIVLAHIATNTRIDTRNALPDVFASAVAGAIDMTFAVARGGNTRVVALPFASVDLN